MREQDSESGAHTPDPEKEQRFKEVPRGECDLLHRGMFFSLEKRNILTPAIVWMNLEDSVLNEVQRYKRAWALGWGGGLSRFSICL